MEELVFAIPTDQLWKLISYKQKGLIKENSEVLQKIVHYGRFHNRSVLEEDSSFKQIIPYAIISNNDSYYLFKRTSLQTEKRLHNKLSLGVGGHMNPVNTRELSEEYLTNELKRELFEEIKLQNGCSIEEIDFIGFLNDDTISVGSVHIGLLYNIHVSSKDVVINETNKMTAEWVNKYDLAEFEEAMETWSKITFDHYIK